MKASHVGVVTARPNYRHCDRCGTRLRAFRPESLVRLCQDCKSDYFYRTNARPNKKGTP